MQAIRRSDYLAPDIDSADLVFVDSHCYIIRRTAKLPDKDADKVISKAANTSSLSLAAVLYEHEWGPGVLAGQASPKTTAGLAASLKRPVNVSLQASHGAC